MCCRELFGTSQRVSKFLIILYLLKAFIYLRTLQYFTIDTISAMFCLDRTTTLHGKHLIGSYMTDLTSPRHEFFIFWRGRLLLLRRAPRALEGGPSERQHPLCGWSWLDSEWGRRTTKCVVPEAIEIRASLQPIFVSGLVSWYALVTWNPNASGGAFPVVYSLANRLGVMCAALNSFK